VILTVCALTGAEAFWRHEGHQPTVTDDIDLWSVHRARVEHATRNDVVLMGASRMQLDFSSAAFHQSMPGRELIRLELDGKRPLATLRDIAENTDFQGVVLCAFVMSDVQPKLKDNQQPNVDYYHKGFPLNRNLNRRISAAMEHRFIVLSGIVNSRNIFKNVI